MKNSSSRGVPSDVFSSIIVLVFLGILATYTGYVIGQFKKAYPQVHNMADAGEVLMGRFGREFLGAGQLLFLIFIMASHILTFSVMMNYLTEHGTCTLVFGVIGTVISFVSNLPRTMKNMSYFSYTGMCAFSDPVSSLLTLNQHSAPSSRPSSSP